MPFALDTLPECFEKEPNNDPAHAQKVKLPVIINGRIDRPDDWDVFQFSGHGGRDDRRRGLSPGGSIPRWIRVLKLTDAGGKLLACNDDHEDPEAGTEHARCRFLSVASTARRRDLLRAPGRHGRNGGEEYAYRLRIGPPQPDFAVVEFPSSLSLGAHQAVR